MEIAEYLDHSNCIDNCFCIFYHTWINSDSVNTGEYPFECKQCCKAFPRKDYLKTHMRLKTCDHDLTTKLNIKIHHRDQSGESPYQCGQCGETYRLNADLKKHFQIHKKVKPYKCDQCDKAFTMKQILKTHDITPTMDKPYQCSQCGKAFSLKVNLSRHLQCHTGEKPYKCCQCNRAYTRQDNLKTHMRTHTGIKTNSEKPYECRKCSESFLLKHHLKTHLKTESHLRSNIGENQQDNSSTQKHYHIDQCETNQYRCNQCSIASPHKDTLKNHMRLNKCDKGLPIFKSKQHIIHTDDKPYKCHQRDKAFTMELHLKTHHSTHTGVKPYQCGDCYKSFSLRDNLCKHLQCHTRDKQYKCSHCDRVYTRLDNLKAHMRKHTGIKTKRDKPYKCKTCNKSFLLKHHLKTHLKTESHLKGNTQTGMKANSDLSILLKTNDVEKPYKCTKCDKSFLLEHYLKAHTKTKSHIKTKTEDNQSDGSFHKKEPLIIQCRGHTEDKPHECKDCGISFSEIRDLISHLLTHIDEI